MIVLNERVFAESCIENGLNGNKPFFVLSILSKYYCHQCGMDKKAIVDELKKYLDNYYPRHKIDKYNWTDTIEKLAASAGKYPLLEISGVKITKSEMAVIEGIHDKVLERLCFTMLCLAKLNNLKNPNNNGWVNTDSKEIFRLARITCSTTEREIRIGKLWKLGLVDFAKRNDNLNCRITFVGDDEEVLFISDFRELGYEYLLYKGQNFIRCAECGVLTRGNKAGTKKYCKDCASYTPQETKKIVCVDCGKEIVIDPKNSRTSRCADCYTIYRANRKLETQQMRRSKDK